MFSDLMIGTAGEVITPRVGCRMAGFGARNGVARGIHDDLHARAMVLDDGRTKAALISVELLAVEASFTDGIRARIEQSTGIPATNVAIAATHTHCGPVTSRLFCDPAQVPEESFLNRLESAIVASVEHAVSDQRRRRIRSGLVRVDGVAVNRRSADGQPTDPHAGVLLVEELDGTPTAIVLSFPCHPTVLGPNTLEISGDFPFYTIERLKKKLGARIQPLYFNGAEGDISIGHRSDLSALGVIAPFRTFEKADELGTKLADAVFSGIPTLDYEDAILNVKSCKLHLPLKSYPPLPALVARRAEAERVLHELEDSASSEARMLEELLRARLRVVFSDIEEYYARLYEQTNAPEPKTLAVELIAFQIGKTALLTLPGEVFVAIALGIRERSRFMQTMFLGLANDYIGYVPTAEANAAAGYEVVASRVAPEAAAVLSEGALDLLKSLAVKSDRP